MEKLSKNLAFSLAEAMILVIILAIAVAASTPIMTKKMVNITEGGSTLTGGNHGRYEVFTKEIITYDGEDYEKTIDPSRPDPGNAVTVFRRLSDSEYIDVVTRRSPNAVVPDAVPNLADDGRKETLYEQINSAKVFRNPSGQITHVDIRGTKHPVGGNIIIENPNLVYWHGELSGHNREDRNFVRDNGSRNNLPTRDRRIIEGNLTRYYHTHPDFLGNKLWHLSVDVSDNNIPVVGIPWERLISGGKIIEDRPLCTNPNCVGSFDPGPKAKNVVVHAVGGGGAGGG